MYVCMHACMHACMYVCTYAACNVCMHACKYAFKMQINRGLVDTSIGKSVNVDMCMYTNIDLNLYFPFFVRSLHNS